MPDGEGTPAYRNFRGIFGDGLTFFVHGGPDRRLG